MDKFSGYQIKKINPNGNFKLQYLNTEKEIELNIFELFPKYLKVSPKHYVDTQDDSIVVINDPILTRKIIIIDNKNIYRKAQQWEYDRFEHINFPLSDNSKFYTHLIFNFD
jgi:hypothetical protein